MRQRGAKKIALRIASEWMRQLLASGNWMEIAELDGTIRVELPDEDVVKIEYELEQIWDRLYQRHDKLSRFKTDGKPKHR